MSKAAVTLKQSIWRSRLIAADTIAGW